MARGDDAAAQDDAPHPQPSVVSAHCQAVRGASWLDARHAAVPAPLVGGPVTYPAADDAGLSLSCRAGQHGYVVAVFAASSTLITGAP
jgi:hypothetical protein